MKKSIHMMLVAFFALAISGGVSRADEKSNIDQRIKQNLKQNLCQKHCGTDLAFEQAIRERIQTGFNNWNRGYEAWLDWCNTLYEPDAYYNVYGQRLTLQQYKDMMGQFFGAYDIQLGALDNILVEGDWVSIRYTVYITNKQTGETSELKTMEFVHFKKNPEPIGARVIEGWAISSSELSVQ